MEYTALKKEIITKGSECSFYIKKESPIAPKSIKALSKNIALLENSLLFSKKIKYGTPDTNNKNKILSIITYPF